MRLLAAALYLALLTGANAADLSGVTLEGDMRKLVVHADPKPVPELTYQTPDGATASLSDHDGKPILLNFWATWCAPCREEMPALQQVQQAGKVEVVTLATGRNSVEGIERFFAEEDITDLPILLDPSQGAARQMAVLGLPVTVLIDADGQEVARLTGGADWADAAAANVLAALASD